MPSCALPSSRASQCLLRPFLASAQCPCARRHCSRPPHDRGQPLSAAAAAARPPKGRQPTKADGVGRRPRAPHTHKRSQARAGKVANFEHFSLKTVHQIQKFLRLRRACRASPIASPLGWAEETTRPDPIPSPSCMHGAERPSPPRGRSTHSHSGALALMPARQRGCMPAISRGCLRASADACLHDGARRRTVVRMPAH